MMGIFFKKREKDKNESESAKMKNKILEAIEMLNQRKGEISHNEEIRNNANNLIESLYDMIFRSIIASLNHSLEATFEAGNIDEKKINIFRKFIKEWLLKVEDEDVYISKDEYGKFKKIIKKFKNKSLDFYKVLDKIEEMIHVKELINKIDECPKSIKEEIIKEHIKKIKRREQERIIREEAEKRLYGKVKTKREIIPKEEREAIFSKFGYICAFCGKDEGLEIHHKDGNPKNNVISNLVVLCGVCHKKFHMKVR